MSLEISLLDHEKNVFMWTSDWGGGAVFHTAIHVPTLVETLVLSTYDFQGYLGH